ncbi:hypothetical protein RvY_04302 [Ramazzottius varieornatus]|uniref:Uncharacterized protein n=1 Tax=Ramazzottius varieornatus TaxID=947166 RepID=A0A1D1UR71_RAMVA|nr:hypothetical protein RvY_04302 [Ramazzottius varieornatus]
MSSALASVILFHKASSILIICDKQKAVVTITERGDHAQMTFPGTDHKKEYDFTIGRGGTFTYDSTEFK